MVSVFAPLTFNVNIFVDGLKLIAFRYLSNDGPGSPWGQVAQVSPLGPWGQVAQVAQVAPVAQVSHLRFVRVPGDPSGFSNLKDVQIHSWAGVFHIRLTAVHRNIPSPS